MSTSSNITGSAISLVSGGYTVTGLHDKIAAALSDTGAQSDDIYEAITTAGKTAASWHNADWWWVRGTGQFWTTADTYEYDMRTVRFAEMSDLAAVCSLHQVDLGRQPMAAVDYRTYENWSALQRPTQATNRPTGYMQTGEPPKVRLMPVPDAVYEIKVDYRQQHPVITADSDGGDLIVPAEFQGGVYYASALWLLRDGYRSGLSLAECPAFVRAMDRMWAARPDALAVEAGPPPVSAQAPKNRIWYPFEITWDTIYDIDDGGVRATAKARAIIAGYIDAYAAAIYVGGTHSDWLLPILAQYDHPIMVGYSWNGIFTPGSSSYEEREDDAERYADWLALLATILATWTPDVVIIDQEYVGSKIAMPADVRSAVDSACSSTTPVYYYDGALQFYSGVGDAPMAPFYNEAPNEDRETGQAIWLADDIPGVVNDWLAWDEWFGGELIDPLVTAREDGLYPADRHATGGSLPWLSLKMDALDYDGEIAPEADLVSLTEKFEAMGAIGYCAWLSPWQDGVVAGSDPYDSAHDTMLARCKAAAKPWVK